MKEEKLNEFKNLLVVYCNQATDDAGRDRLKLLVKDRISKCIQALSTDELEKIIKELKDVLSYINTMLKINPTAISLLISKSEILTYLGNICWRKQQFERAKNFFEKAIKVNNLTNAFINIEADWGLLSQTIEKKESKEKTPQGFGNRLSQELTVLKEYYKSIGDNKAERKVQERIEIFKRFFGLNVSKEKIVLV